MTDAVALPLRERKKAETWTALHEAAASLALQHGVEQATVEAIAASAGVSPRTFFNYFQAKEDAILGLREPVLEASLLAEISVTADDLVGQVSRLLMTVASTALGGDDRARRRQLIARDPHLGRRHMDYMVKAETLVCQGLAGVLGSGVRLGGRRRRLRPRGIRAHAGDDRRRPHPLQAHLRRL